MTPERSPAFRFGEFELDLAAYQLRRAGRKVKLGRQPMDLPILLVERRGQLVTRADIVTRLWGPDVFVDVETGVNTAVSKVRQALRDAPDAPRFVETVPGKGYRFIADVVRPVVDGPAADVPPTATAVPALAQERPPVRFGGGVTALVAGVAVLVAIGVALGVRATRPRGGNGASGAVSIAVLPFTNLGSDPDRDYLAAGLTDETSASLARVDPRRLTVKGRTLQYKGTTKSAAEIGRELTVDYLVESSVRGEGARLRVAVALIRVRDQEHVWSQIFDREATTLLALQQELSAAIAEQVRLTLSPEGLRGLQTRQTLDAAAYDAYLRGRYQLHRRTADGNRQAIGLFREAVALDRGYALAWAQLAFVYMAGTINGDARPAAITGPADEAASRAVAANPALPEVQLALGYKKWLIDWKWPEAEAAFRRAIELDPSDASVHRVLGHALSQAGRQAEAEAAMRRARELDPMDPLIWALSSQVAFQGRDFAAAATFARRAIVLGPQLWIGYLELGAAYAAAGEHDLALEAIADAERLAGGNSKVPSLRGYVLARQGRTAAARDVIRALDDAARARYVPPYATALIHAGLGERDAMYEALERAYAERDVHLIYLPVDAKWDPYRRDGRFVDLLTRCGFASGR